MQSTVMTTARKGIQARERVTGPLAEFGMLSSRKPGFVTVARMSLRQGRQIHLAMCLPDDLNPVKLTVKINSW